VLQSMLSQISTLIKQPTMFHAIITRIGVLLLLLHLSINITIALQTNHNSKRSVVSRRESIFQGIKQASCCAAVVVLPVLTLFRQDARAACMPGDLSADCIGVYKIPLQDALSSPTLNSKEALKQNAPDMKYVKPIEIPTNVARAKEELLAQREAANDIQNVISAGRLEEAGIKVLRLIPVITGAGMAIQEQVQIAYPVSNGGANQMRVMKYQQGLQELVALWSGIDVEIGQGLRGQLGSSVVAQLAILKSIEEANAAFDDFLLLLDSNTNR